METTRNGYESQLRMMSEHLANQNQKITELTDEVSMLREAMIDRVSTERLTLQLFQLTSNERISGAKEK